MCNSKLYHNVDKHPVKYVQKVFFDFVEINALPC